jgi:hypothetical protein
MEVVMPDKSERNPRREQVVQILAGALAELVARQARRPSAEDVADRRPASP